MIHRKPTPPAPPAMPIEEIVALARKTWSKATELPGDVWLGGSDPAVEQLLAVVRTFLDEGATETGAMGWKVLHHPDGRCIAAAAGIVAEAKGQAG